MLTDTQKENFLSKINFGNEDECWLWIAGTTTKGYGEFGADKKTYLAHRLAFTILVGEIPEGCEVMHSCKNKTCCNPAHLSYGDQYSNMIRMVELGKLYKLKPEQILEIRSRYHENRNNKNRRVTQDMLAIEYGVSQRQISHIVNGKRWSRI